jgi:hypothetical protein
MIEVEFQIQEEPEDTNILSEAKYEYDRQLNFRLVPLDLFPDLYEKIGRIEGLILTLSGAIFKGEIKIIVGRNGSLISGKVSSIDDETTIKIYCILDEVDKICHYIWSMISNGGNGQSIDPPFYSIMFVYKRD